LGCSYRPAPPQADLFASGELRFSTFFRKEERPTKHPGNPVNPVWYGFLKPFSFDFEWIAISYEL
jgi:hypothetical protein